MATKNSDKPSYLMLRGSRARIIETFTHLLDGEIAAVEKSGRDPVNAYITLKTTGGDSQNEVSTRVDLSSIASIMRQKPLSPKPRSSRR